MADADGHKVTWFSSARDLLQDMVVEVGVPFTAKFTPKKHDFSSYNKCDDTVVNRLAVVA